MSSERYQRIIIDKKIEIAWEVEKGKNIWVFSYKLQRIKKRGGGHFLIGKSPMSLHTNKALNDTKQIEIRLKQ